MAAAAETVVNVGKDMAIDPMSVLKVVLSEDVDTDLKEVSVRTGSEKLKLTELQITTRMRCK